jgi:hypothetical protein
MAEIPIRCGHRAATKYRSGRGTRSSRHDEKLSSRLRMHDKRLTSFASNLWR